MNVLAWPVLFSLNLLCKRGMKRAGWTEEDMAELQRLMLDLGPDRLDIDRRIEPKFETMEAAE
jgi:hypothetical protein